MSVPIRAKKAKPETSIVKAGETPLQTPWTIHWWKQGPMSRQEEYEEDTPALYSKERQQYLETVKQLGAFNSVEGFWEHYLHIRKASRLQLGMNVAYFRSGLQPAWESFPNGGCWIIRVPKQAAFLDRLWEELLIATLGEQLLTPELVGIVVSVRRQYTNITVWNRSNLSSEGKGEVRFRIGERLKNILNLADDSTVDYKEFARALVDRSTHRNATAYTYTTVPAQPDYYSEYA